MKCQHFERRAAVKPVSRVEEMLTLWRDIAVAVAGTERAKDVGTPGRWAHKVIDDYAGVLLAVEKERNRPND